MRTLATLSDPALIIHPVRLRIIETLASRSLTTLEIAALLPDIPQATLYRQVAVLAGAKILEVVDQRRVRGVTEYVYRVKRHAAHFSRSEFARFTPRQHVRFFSILLATLTSAIGRYVRQRAFDTTADGMTYFAASLLLNDAEARKFRIELLALMDRFARKPANRDRRLRLVGACVIPEPRENP